MNIYKFSVYASKKGQFSSAHYELLLSRVLVLVISEPSDQMIYLIFYMVGIAMVFKASCHDFYKYVL